MADVRVVAAELTAAGIRVEFEGAAPSSAEFHAFWLRHQCPCCRHPQTHERTLCPSRVSLDTVVRALRTRDEGRVLELEFEASALRADGRGQGDDDALPHVSRFSAQWLAEHAYAPDRAPRAAALGVEALEVAPGEGWPQHCLERTQARGAAVARGVGDDTEAHVVEFEALCLEVVPTHFGRIEDLRTDNTTNQNTDQLGYTDAAVDLHTDQPFLEEPPRYQVLHCMRPAAAGGDSAIADGHAAARALRDEDRQAFELLSSTSVAFHRQQRAFEKRLEAPIVELRGDRIARVRASYFTLAPIDLPFDRMEAWYRAYQRFVALIEDPRHRVQFRLEAGDLLMYDNFRMLHARTRFEGARWVRGIYFNPIRDDPASG